MNFTTVSFRRSCAVCIFVLCALASRAQSFDFTGVFDPDQWTFTSGGTGSTLTWDGNSGFTITGSQLFNNQTTLAYLSIDSLPSYYLISFDWSFTSNDPGGPQFDPAGYNSEQLSTNSGSSQSGRVTDGLVTTVLQFYAVSDNWNDPTDATSSLTISNFSYTLTDAGEGGGGNEPPPPPAGTVVWTGSASNDWQDSANWNPSAPDSTTVVEIAGGNTPVLSGNAATADVYSFSVTESAVFTLNDGAQLTAIGAFVNDNGTLALTGAGTSLTTTSFATIGHNSHGTFTISDGATATVGNLWSSMFDSATSTVTIDGTGSRLTSTGAEGPDIIGYDGASQFTVCNGGRYDAVKITVGYFNSGAPATLTVTGAGSQLNTTGMLKLGEFGEGVFILSAGAVANTGNAAIAYGSLNGAGDVTGTATVTGAGSAWNITGNLGIGSYADASMFTQGTLTIADGGLVNVNNGTGTATIDRGSTLNIGSGGLSGTLAVASVETGGSLVFNHTDNIVFAATIKDYIYAATPGTLLKSGSGTLSLTGTSTYSGGTTIDAGTLQIGNGGTTGSITGDVVIASGATLAFNRSNAITFDGILSGAGALSQAGSGVLTLTGANTHTGLTAINAGTLALGASASLANTSSIRIGSGATFDVSAVSGGLTLASGQTLGGSGSVTGLVTFASGSHLAPGSSPGTITFTGGLTLNTGAFLDFELGTVSDKIRVSGGTLTGPGSGKLTVNLFDSGGFTAGTYTLIDATGATLTSIGATNFELGTVIAGYTYTFSQTGKLFQLTATSAIPEPSAYILIVGSVALALTLLRRRRLVAP